MNDDLDVQQLADEQSVKEADAPASDPLAAIGARLMALEAATSSLSAQVALVPAQVRSLATRVDGLTTSIGETRFRALLLELLAVYDLVDQLLRTTSLTGGNELHQHNYDVLRTQIRQVLEGNGLTEIPAEGAFDPQLHRAMQRVAVDDPTLDGRIVSIVRAGFRAGPNVLRYAEVAVGYVEPRVQTPVDSPAAV